MPLNIERPAVGAAAELGYPPVSDAEALDLIAEWLRDPDWDAELLNDLALVIQRSGRPTDNYPDNRSTRER